MVDFLRNNPYVSREQYMWEWTIPQIRLASFDYTHVLYFSAEEAKERKRYKHMKTYDDPSGLVNDLGIPIFKLNQQKK